MVLRDSDKSRERETHGLSKKSAVQEVVLQDSEGTVLLQN